MMRNTISRVMLLAALTIGLSLLEWGCNSDDGGWSGDPQQIEIAGIHPPVIRVADLITGVRHYEGEEVLYSDLRYDISFIERQVVSVSYIGNCAYAAPVPSPQYSTKIKSIHIWDLKRDTIEVTKEFNVFGHPIDNSDTVGSAHRFNFQIYPGRAVRFEHDQAPESAGEHQYLFQFISNEGLRYETVTETVHLTL